MFFRRVTTTTGLFLIAILLSSCQPAGDESEAGGSGAGEAVDRAESPGDEDEAAFEELATVELSAQERNLMDIAFQPAVRGALSETIIRDGKVSPHQDRVAKVGPVIPGRVKEILVKLGDWVEEGRPMAKLVSSEVGQALSDYYKSIQELELAQANLDRYRRLIEQDIGARKDLLAAEAEQKIALASVNASEKTLHALGFTEDDVTEIRETHKINAELLLRAPIAGEVVERLVTIGERVGEDATLFTIMDLRKVYVDAQIYERDVHRVQKGQRVEVSVGALPGRVFNGSVSYISPLLDPESRTLTVRTEIANPEKILKQGMLAVVKISTGSNGDTLCIPADAVVEEAGSSYVFTTQGENFRLIPVTIGETDQDYTEIVEGLEEGDEVVTKGTYELYSKFKRRARLRRRGGASHISH